MSALERCSLRSGDVSARARTPKAPHLNAPHRAGHSQKVINFVAKITKDDLEAMRELLEAGTVKSVIDRRYELREVPEALRYLGTTHARGTVLIFI
jgi:NADPH:quinone reductase-like Zn-dependent oxidoreductase